MTRRYQVLSLLALLLTSSVVTSWAHDDFRVVGVVTKATSTAVDVKNNEGKSFSIKTNKQTTVTRENKKVGASEVKAGTNVVIDARGDSEQDLLAVDIRIVPVKK